MKRKILLLFVLIFIALVIYNYFEAFWFLITTFREILYLITFLLMLIIILKMKFPSRVILFSGLIITFLGALLNVVDFKIVDEIVLRVSLLFWLIGIILTIKEYMTND